MTKMEFQSIYGTLVNPAAAASAAAAPAPAPTRTGNQAAKLVPDVLKPQGPAPLRSIQRTDAIKTTAMRQMDVDRLQAQLVKKLGARLTADVNSAVVAVTTPFVAGGADSNTEVPFEGGLVKLQLRGYLGHQSFALF